MKRRPGEEDWSRRNEETSNPKPVGRRLLIAAAIFGLIAVIGIGARLGSANRQSEKTRTTGRIIRPPKSPRLALPAIKTNQTAGKQTSTARSPINVNTASMEELDTLPNISRQRSQAIIDGRPYSKPEDLLRVPALAK